MMSMRAIRLMAVVMMLLWGSAFGNANAQTQTADDSGNTTDIQAFVIQSASTANIRRAEWTDFTHLSLGAALQKGDLIDPKGQSVRVLCADLSEQVIAVLGPVPCPKDRSIVTQDQLVLAGWQRGSIPDVTIPYLISPRHTLIADANPLIIWNTVPEADSYRVTMRGEGLNWSTIVKNATTHQLAYPKNAPKLQVAVPYTVEIEALAQGSTISSSDSDETPDRSFTLMTHEQLATFQSLITKVRAIVSDEHVANLIAAQIYADHKVYADALDLLLTASPDNKPGIGWQASPIPALVLGDIYLSTGVQPEAQAAYTEALQVAQQSNDLASQALALTGLARCSNADPVKRAQYAAQTLDAWHTLGSTTEAALIEKEFSPG